MLCQPRIDRGEYVGHRSPQLDSADDGLYNVRVGIVVPKTSLFTDQRREKRPVVVCWESSHTMLRCTSGWSLHSSAGAPAADVEARARPVPRASVLGGATRRRTGRPDRSDRAGGAGWRAVFMSRENAVGSGVTRGLIECRLVRFHCVRSRCRPGGPPSVTARAGVGRSCRRVRSSQIANVRCCALYNDPVACDTQSHSDRTRSLCAVPW